MVTPRTLTITVAVGGDPQAPDSWYRHLRLCVDIGGGTYKDMHQACLGGAGPGVACDELTTFAVF